MKNPGKWWPMEPEEPGGSDPRGGRSGTGPANTRLGAVVGLILVLLLVAGGLLLTHVLGGMAQLQDCALSGRSNCS